MPAAKSVPFRFNDVDNVLIARVGERIGYKRKIEIMRYCLRQTAIQIGIVIPPGFTDKRKGKKGATK